MAAVFLNIVIGLTTTILSGGSVWLWQHGKNARILRRKAALFGLTPGRTCLIVMTSRYDNPMTSSNIDVQAFMEVAALANEIGCPVSIVSSADIHESNGDRTEFCIGGPDSNPRTRGHLASHLPGVTICPYNPADPDSIAIAVGLGNRRQLYRFDRGNQEYAVVAKFTPKEASRPVIVIGGQTAIMNRAAIHLLIRDYRQITKTLASIDRFCIIIRPEGTSTYGHHAASIERDATKIAFAGQ